VTDLRPYQSQAIQEIELAINDAQAPLYVLPTGAGKTVVAAQIIERTVAAGKRVLVLTHRREILKQTSLKLSGSNLEHGLIQAGLNLDLDPSVQIASIQTLWARCMRTDKAPLPAANLIIVDEAHHIAARTWRKIIEAYPNARLIGLTATPCRSDGRGLGNHFTKIIEGPQIPELIADKWLVPTTYYAPVDPDLRGVQTRQGDYVVSQLADRMNRDDLVGDIVSNWHKFGERRKTLVFCVDVAHSVHVKNEFVNSGVKAEHIDGGTPKSERDDTSPSAVILQTAADTPVPPQLAQPPKKRLPEQAVTSKAAKPPTRAEKSKRQKDRAPVGAVAHEVNGRTCAKGSDKPAYGIGHNAGPPLNSPVDFAFASLLGKILPHTLAADVDSSGGRGGVLFERVIVWPDGQREIEGKTPKQLQAPSPVSVENHDQLICVEKPSQNSASDDQ
jgi:hypothetical protein